MSSTINLRDFYPWYTNNEFVEVSDEVAAELLADKRYEKSHERKVFRYKAQYSLDVDNGIETAAINLVTNDPLTIIGIKEQNYYLCKALNSLPEVQGRRIEAHYIFGKSKTEIARAEGVTKGVVSVIISRGLKAMEKYFKNNT